MMAGDEYCGLSVEKEKGEYVSLKGMIRMYLKMFN